VAPDPDFLGGSHRCGDGRPLVVERIEQLDDKARDVYP
jgi:hypothetical protein